MHDIIKTVALTPITWPDVAYVGVWCSFWLGLIGLILFRPRKYKTY